MQLSDIKLYRMIHIDNLPHVLKFGITHKNSKNRNNAFIQIGDESLIDNRSSKKVWVTNGNLRNAKTPSIILGDFIPFYFGVRMPMLYVIQNGGNFVKASTAPQNIIYIACSLDSVISVESEYYFSDGHGTDNFTEFYDQDHIEDLPKIINWGAIKNAYWGGTENLLLKRKKQAEFLILEDLGPEHIFGFGCYNDSTKHKLKAMGIAENQIKVIPSAYY